MSPAFFGGDYTPTRMVAEEEKVVIDAVNTVIRALREDPTYLESWKSSISMAFVDECHLRGLKDPLVPLISIAAAERFLRLLTR
jgi:hypothetical protein